MYARNFPPMQPELNRVRVLIVCQVRKVEREKKKLLKMWNTTRARLLEAERVDWIGEGDQTPAHVSTSGKARTGQELVGEARAGRRSRTRARRSTKKGATPTKVGNEKREGLFAVLVGGQVGYDQPKKALGAAREGQKFHNHITRRRAGFSAHPLVTTNPPGLYVSPPLTAVCLAGMFLVFSKRPLPQSSIHLCCSPSPEPVLVSFAIRRAIQTMCMAIKSVLLIPYDHQVPTLQVFVSPKMWY